MISIEILERGCGCGKPKPKPVRPTGGGSK